MMILNHCGTSSKKKKNGRTPYGMHYTHTQTFRNGCIVNSHQVSMVECVSHSVFLQNNNNCNDDDDIHSCLTSWDFYSTE